MKRLIAFAIFMFFIGEIAISQPLMQPYNLDFEDGTVGANPTGWYLPTVTQKKGYTSRMTELNPYQGKYCAEIEHDVFNEDNDENYGSLMQSIDARIYRNKYVTFRAAVRAELTGSKSSAHLWVHVRLTNDQTAILDFMEDRPIVINDWQFYEITVEVHPDAEFVNYGLMLRGSGKAWIDAASFNIESDTLSKVYPPAPINPHSMENIVSFAKLFGYIKFFNASNEAENTDWDLLSAAGAKAVENAVNSDSLKSVLLKIIKPSAPTLKIINSDSVGNRKEIAVKPKTALDNFSFCNVISGIYTSDPTPAFFAKQMNVFDARREREAAAMQVIDAAELIGKRIRFSADIRCQPANPAGQAQLWIRMDSASNKILKTVTMDDKPARIDKWQNYFIETDVPAGVKVLRLGLVLLGDAAASFDNVKLSVIDKKKELVQITLRNPDFEDLSGRQDVIPGWHVPPGVSKAGYTVKPTKINPASGAQCLRFETDTNTIVRFPEPGEYCFTDIGLGLIAAYQLALFADSMGTLPVTHYSESQNAIKKFGITSLSINDRYSRLGIVITTWNLIKHFNLNNLDSMTLESALRTSLAKAATDSTEYDFLNTMNMLLAILNDSQARIWLGSEVDRHGLPILWKWSGDKLIVTQAKPGININAGDEIIKIENIPVNDYLTMSEKNFPGATVGWKRLRALAELRVGKENSSLKLTALASDGKLSEIELKRNVLLNEMVENRPPALHEVDSAVLYVDMTRVADEDFKGLAEDLHNAKGIIFDARGNSLISEYMLGYFIDEPIKGIEWQIPLYTMPDRKMVSYKKIRGLIKNFKTRLHAKIVFIADERTLGYTEAVLKLVKDNKLGEVIGSATAGTIGEIATIRLPAGLTFTLTAIAGIDSNGKNLPRTGIEPTKPFVISKDALVKGSDGLIEAAIGVINGK